MSTSLGSGILWQILIEMNENIKLPPEEEGKVFRYFPFKELPPVTTQVIEEVIECEIDNININIISKVTSLDGAIHVAMGSYNDKISVSLVGRAPVTTSHSSSLLIALLG